MERLSDAARRIGARLHGADAAFQRVGSDSRSLRRGDLFVALRGERFDGHDYVLRAASLGAAGALVSHVVEGGPPQLCVDDTLAGLQAYAASWRRDFELPLVAVTGSSGKTTTRQMIAAVCAARGPVLSSQGNLNNHIGVPLTLLGLRGAHRTAVIEMGANHAGEIARLCQIAVPDVAVVTQAGDAHLEGFGSREGVARAKGEMFAALGGRGVAVINRDDAYFELWRGLAGAAAVISFGLREGADVTARDIDLQARLDGGEAGAASRFTLVTPHGEARVELPLPGRHNVANALAAAAAGLAVGLEPPAIAAGLGRVAAVSGRLNWCAARGGARLLDDSYNANPTSLRAALELLAGLPGQRWVVLGDMRELGADEAALHEDAGRAARALGLERLYTTGALARHAADGFGPHARHFDTQQALVEALQDDIAEAGAGVAVLVKGSRSSRMDRVVAALAGRAEQEAH
ncbi:MAG: UDP-N-acetylmuramoyl-tripeptide--D-alanyl-D-alanine ligase [Nevskia sp.]|nr:UDP-N-acetylmuramoyl-tripeptide--D-alanyl-D-alanine ligase [Nevskia sp.]